MSKRRKSPQTKLVEVIQEIGLPAVKHIIATLEVYETISVKMVAISDLDPGVDPKLRIKSKD